jgi:hypothetical protein
MASLFSDQNYPVDKKELIEHLKKNREAHIKKHAEAMEGYKIEVAEHAEALLKAVKETPLEDLDHNEVLKDLRRPVSYKDHYDEALEKLKWFQGDELVLNESQFTSYVLDRWRWKGEFEVVSKLFRTKAGYRN